MTSTATRASILGLGAALALAGCAPPHPHLHLKTPLRVVSRLDCPESEDELQRKSADPDGRSCLYAGSQGEEVSLQLVDLNGQDASAALAPLSDTLRAELPAATADKGASGMDKENVDIDLPGVHIHAHDNGSAGEKSGGPKTVNISEGSSVHITGPEKGGGGVDINANDNGAEIHIKNDSQGDHLTFILASDTAGPHGYKVVGYEARGPAGGPLVVASAKSPGKGDNDELHHAIGRLLRLNVGG